MERRGVLFRQKLESRWFVYAAISVGVLMRIGVLSYLRQFPLSSDAHEYHEMAVGILHGTDFSIDFPPGLPYLLAFAYRVLGESELVGRAASLLCYIAFSVLLYRLALDVFSRRSANIAVFWFALLPANVWQSAETLSQLPTATGLLAICYLTLLQRRAASWRKLALLGITLGIVVLIRPSNLLLAASVPGYVLVTSKRVSHAVVPLVLCAAVICCWLVKAHDMTGRFVMINDANSINFFFGNNAYTPLYKTWWFGSHGDGEHGVPAEYTALCLRIQEKPKVEQNRTYRKIAIQHVLSRPDLFLVRSLNRIRAFFAFDTTTGLFPRRFYGASTVVSLGLIGLDALFYNAVLVGCVLFLFSYVKRKTELDYVQLLWLVVLLYSVPYWFSFAHPTYHFPIVPLLGIFAAEFAGRCLGDRGEEAMNAIASSKRRRYGLVIMLFLCVFVQVEWVLVNFGRI